MERNFHQMDKSKIKLDLQEFYIEYNNNIILPQNSKFGLEIEFKIASYKSELIDFITNNSNDDIIELSNYIDSFFRRIGYNFPWDVTYEMNEHLEIISPILTNSKSDWDTLKNILDLIKTKGAYYSGACGAHIHIEKSILKNNKDSWLNFFKLWYLFEDIIIKFTNGENYFERKNFSISSRRCRDDIIKLIDNFDNEKYKLPKGLCNKKSSLMLERKKVSELLESVNGDYSVENTIEFRCPNGTLNEIIWQNNIRFFLNLLSATASRYFDSEKLNYYMEENNRTKEFLDNIELYLVDFVFTKEYDKLCFLRQYYKDFNEPEKYSPFAISTPFWK